MAATHSLIIVVSLVMLILVLGTVLMWGKIIGKSLKEKVVYIQGKTQEKVRDLLVSYLYECFRNAAFSSKDKKEAKCFTLYMDTKNLGKNGDIEVSEVRKKVREKAEGLQSGEMIFDVQFDEFESGKAYRLSYKIQKETPKLVKLSAELSCKSNPDGCQKDLVCVEGQPCNCNEECLEGFTCVVVGKGTCQKHMYIR